MSNRGKFLGGILHLYPYPLDYEKSLNRKIVKPLNRKNWGEVRGEGGDASTYPPIPLSPA